MANVWVKTVLALGIPGIAAALFVDFFTWRANWRHQALAVADVRPQESPFTDASEDWDDVLAQSFPASDPPSSTSGIARVRPPTG